MCKETTKTLFSFQSKEGFPYKSILSYNVSNSFICNIIKRDKIFRTKRDGDACPKTTKLTLL